MALSVAVCPEQIVEFGPAVAVIPGDTVTESNAVSAQLPIATMTEYVVLAVGETII